MAYEVTATRRRPQIFEDLVGQEFVTATLKNSIQSGKIAHAYLFSGPRGCGKTTSARILSRALNCLHGPSAVPCGTCAACTEIARGASMDVIEIDGASNTSVNDVRQIKDEVLFPPNAYRYKIYIIDEVHMLSTSAFNALLKTIEEPPPYVIFIFATTELHKVPATIKSRCQQFHFRLGSVEQIKDLLVQTAAESNIRADEEALYWIAREATGSFRDAYTLFDQVAAFSDTHITYDKIRDTLGLVGIDQLNEICEFCSAGKNAEALEKIDEALQAGISIEQFISNTADYLRSLLLIKCGITKEALLGQAAGRFSAEVVTAWSEQQLEHALSLFLQLFRDIRYSLNQRFELELVICKMCWLSSYISAAELQTAINKTHALLAHTSSPQNMNILTSTEEQPKLTSPQKQTAPQRVWIQPPPDTPVSYSSREAVPEKKPEIPKPTAPDTLARPVPPADEKKNFTEVNRSLQEILEEAVLTLGQTKPSIASALQQTHSWLINGHSLQMTAPTAYIKNQIEREISTISSILIPLFHIGQLDISVSVEIQKKQIEQTSDYPPEVAAVCAVFEGTCVSVIEKSSYIQNQIEKSHDEEVSENYDSQSF